MFAWFRFGCFNFFVFHFFSLTRECARLKSHAHIHTRAQLALFIFRETFASVSGCQIAFCAWEIFDVCTQRLGAIIFSKSIRWCEEFSKFNFRVKLYFCGSSVCRILCCFSPRFCNRFYFQCSHYFSNRWTWMIPPHLWYGPKIYRACGNRKYPKLRRQKKKEKKK